MDHLLGLPFESAWSLAGAELLLVQLGFLRLGDPGPPPFQNSPQPGFVLSLHLPQESCRPWLKDCMRGKAHPSLASYPGWSLPPLTIRVLLGWGFLLEWCWQAPPLWWPGTRDPELLFEMLAYLKALLRCLQLLLLRSSHGFTCPRSQGVSG